MCECVCMKKIYNYIHHTCYVFMCVCVCVSAAFNHCFIGVYQLSMPITSSVTFIVCFVWQNSGATCRAQAPAQSYSHKYTQTYIHTRKCFCSYMRFLQNQQSHRNYALPILIATCHTSKAPLQACVIAPALCGPRWWDRWQGLSISYSLIAKSCLKNAKGKAIIRHSFIYIYVGLCVCIRASCRCSNVTIKPHKRTQMAGVVVNIAYCWRSYWLDYNDFYFIAIFVAIICVVVAMVAFISRAFGCCCLHWQR